jgi:hypothetical protein
MTKSQRDKSAIITLRAKGKPMLSMVKNPIDDKVACKWVQYYQLSMCFDEMSEAPKEIKVKIEKVTNG